MSILHTTPPSSNPVPPEPPQPDWKAAAVQWVVHVIRVGSPREVILTFGLIALAVVLVVLLM